MTKRIVLFADGTWQSGETSTKTNVWRLMQAVLPADSAGVKQLTYYHDGVGADGLVLAKAIEGATGLGVDQYAIALYQHLVDVYEDGDLIYIFGFSRGAYSARCISGLIRNSGVLRPENKDQIQAAYQLYLNQDPSKHPRSSDAAAFRNQFSYKRFVEPQRNEFVVEFIGVWDTVGALGIPYTNIDKKLQQFHDTSLSTHVHYAYQALAADERRGGYMPCLWTKQDGPGPEGSDEQKLIQAWFAGVHSDIGGGYTERGLANCTLTWMAAKAKATGLALDPNAIYSGGAPDPGAGAHDSMTFFFKLLALLKDGTRYPERLGPLSNGVDINHQYTHQFFLDRCAPPTYPGKNMRTFLDRNPVPLTDSDFMPMPKS